MKRLFAAIKIHPANEFVRIYTELQNSLHDSKIKWVDVNNVHLTLKFFGETAESQIPVINNALHKVASENTMIELKLIHSGIFGSSYNPRVIWFGIDRNPVLEKLADDVLDAMENIGYERDRQNFVPHLTIGRIKYISDRKKFEEVIQRYKSVEIQQEKIDCFHLYESILRPQGPEYRVIDSFSLD
jgi:2'-5' RNA ligase